jgi:large subunit ribosomal protein L21e
MALNKGYRNKSRSVYRKPPRKRGQNPIDHFLIEFEKGEKVAIIGDPAQHQGGLPHRRYYGKTGTVIGIRGRCYEVEVSLGKSKKMLILSKDHLKSLNLKSKGK